MSTEHLKTELARAEDAELQSEEQLRQLMQMIDKASGPNAPITATDCSKLISAALGLNERLRDRVTRLRSAVHVAEMKVRTKS